ncbi:Monooxygenase [Lachnellula hyalina]|uniref:Monooxygenase n=1 Tax=Lachnellula hyalina TaxID=1316788 RepID=A0A8H8R4G0_9HELO|nr:Monooxygenase [Lachnellula hyalina]TVY27856.1 Monooxygenase [Lachnellula hyalina]
MTFKALSPEPFLQRPLSQAARGWQSKLHPLRSNNGRNLIHSQFSISDWLVIGSCLQALIILVSPYSVAHSLAPTFALAAYKIMKTVCITCRLHANPHMDGVRIGRTTAIFPASDGSFDRNKGDTFGGEGICVFLLSTKCNHPLGMMYPPFKTLLDHGRDMFIELDKNPADYGFLGHSTYDSTEDITKPVSMSILYFRSLEHVYKFAHSKIHRAGWDWFTKMGANIDQVSIGHEVYDVPKGKWENIYVNAKPYGFAATSHAIKTDGVERQWVCPLIDAKKMGGKQRMEPIKG